MIHFYSLSNRKRVALKFANFDAIARIKGIDFFSKNITMLFLNSFIALLMIFAVSGLTVQTFMESSTFSFVIVIDTSESMEADDLFPNRATVAKQTAVDFIDAAPFGVNFGIVSFSGSAYLEQEMTDDKTEIKNVINNIEVEGWGGTDLHEAVITSIRLLQDEEHKAIIVLSDGQINVGKLEDIVDYAQKNNVIIHCIAVGTKEGGKTPYAISKLDEESLKTVSYNTGGNYFLAEDKETLSQSFLDILKLTNKEVSIRLENYLVLFAIFLFVVEFFLINTKYLNII
jgi:Ca-activated chloride channel family protein